LAWSLLPISGLTPKAKPRSSKALQLLTGLAGAKREPRMPYRPKSFAGGKGGNLTGRLS
jgi:hypothetical protein